MEKNRQDFDNVAWDLNDTAWDKSLKQLRLISTCRTVEALVARETGKVAKLVSPLVVGGYNMLYRVRLGGEAADVMVRVPCPDLVQFPHEKTLREAATVKYIEQHTHVPVAHVIHYGQDPDIGPLVILQHVNTRQDLSDVLTVPEQHPDDTPVLNDNISEQILEDFYGKVACVLLQLLQLSFPRIGSIVEIGKDSFTISARPITQNMNNMVQIANIPRSILSKEEKTYSTADEWYAALSEMHIAQLVFQHNDLVSTEDDCRNKYVARQLFHRLARQGQLSTFGFAEDNWSAQSKNQSSIRSPAPSGSGSFRLWCDDFRPVNILLDDADEIAAVIDWEFAYAAPTQFVLDPPWWLLLDVPEMWSSGIEEWEKLYDKRLQNWLSAMKQAEVKAELDSIPFPLSAYMRESWETGRFWLNYAARKSWAFDTIFWTFLDERFFGKRGGEVPERDLWKTRVHLLSEEERMAMEPFVERKMREGRERVLVDWSPEQADEYLSRVLFG